MIQARGLARTFKGKSGPVEAVRGVDFEVAGGEIVGFPGPNGAGKTPTLRMLATLLAPTAGDATVPAVICAAIHAACGGRPATWRRAAPPIRPRWSTRS